MFLGLPVMFWRGIGLFPSSHSASLHCSLPISAGGGGIGFTAPPATPPGRDSAPAHGQRERLEPGSRSPLNPAFPGRKRVFPAAPGSEAVRGLPSSKRFPRPLGSVTGLRVWLARSTDVVCAARMYHSVEEPQVLSDLGQMSKVALLSPRSSVPGRAFSGITRPRTVGWLAELAAFRVEIGLGSSSVEGITTRWTHSERVWPRGPALVSFPVSSNIPRGTPSTRCSPRERRGRYFFGTWPHWNVANS